MKDFIKLIRFIIPHKKSAALNIIFNIIGNFFGLFTLTLIVPFLGILFGSQKIITQEPEFAYTASAMKDYLMYLLSQQITLHGRAHAMLIITGLILIFSFLKNSFLYLAGYNMAWIVNAVVRDMQRQIYSKILSLPLAYFSEERKGNIIARITNDVLEIKTSIMSSLEIIFRDPITIVMYFIALIYLSPLLTGVVFILLPLSGLIIGVIGKKLRSKSNKGREKYGDLISLVEETLSGLRIIKAFNAEKRVSKRFSTENESFTKIITNVTRISALASPLSEFLGTLSVLIILFIGSSLVFSEQSYLSPENFIGYIVVFSQIITPIKSISSSYYNIQKGLASFDRVRVITEAEETIVESPNAEPIKTFESDIELKKVSFRYDDKGVVLKDINLKIKKGLTIALVGQSGSGKSTLVDLLPRFYDIQEGEILIDGKNIIDLKIKDLRHLMGNVNQESILFNDTIFNNIAFGVESASIEQVIEAAKVANAHDFIMETPEGYQTNIGDRGGKLSGGQRQRVSIARAVLKNPPILILDEATSALDTESERLVQDALTKLMENRTSIVIAHRLSTIKHADEICVLHDGEIVERGNHEVLIEKNGVYKKLHDLQMF